MTRVVLQPCAGAESRRHYRDTVERPVDLSTLNEFLDPAQQTLLGTAHPDGAAALWGAMPGARHQQVPKWERMQAGDHIFFAGGGVVFADAVVTATLRNPTLAQSLWGTAMTGNGQEQTWELMFAMDPVTEVDIPITDLNSAIGRAPNANVQEFVVLDPELSAAALALLSHGVQPHSLIEAPVAFDWPTVEWVKAPVDRDSGEPSGSPVRMRHFLDCPHWYRDADGQLLGDPPTLATDDQMRELPACHDCARKAAAAGNADSGPRVAEFLDESVDASVRVRDMVTDGIAVTAVRREQKHLRSHLLSGRDHAPCALCGRILPASLLIAAHITPRHTLNEAERLDFTSAAMLACALGCDSLFELGYIAVDDTGRVVATRPSDSEAVAAAVTALAGRSVAAYGPDTAGRFALHRAAQALPHPS